MGIAEAIAALAKLLDGILGWIRSGTTKSPTEVVQSDKGSISQEMEKTKETGRPQ